MSGAMDNYTAIVSDGTAQYANDATLPDNDLATHMAADPAAALKRQLAAHPEPEATMAPAAPAPKPDDPFSP